MNIVDLESFVAVVESGSIVAAASRLHITQSAISKRVQNLEDALGVSLLDRQKRPLQLTPVGKATYKAAKPVLTSVEGLRSSITHAGEPSGDFGFGIARSLGDEVILKAVRALREDFPQLQMQAYSQWSSVLVERVVSGGLEAAVVLQPRGTNPAAQGVEFEYLGRHAAVLVGARGIALPSQAGLKDLPGKCWVISPVGCSLRASMEFALMQQRLPLEISVEAEGKELQMALAAETHGVCVVPRGTFERSRHKKNLKVIELTDFDPEQDLWLVKSRYLGHLAKAVDRLREGIMESEAG